MAKKKTYAQEAKAIMNRYKLRLGENFDKNDRLAEKAMEAELSALRERQEADREALFAEESPTFAKGGKLPMYYDGGTFLPGMGRFQQGVAPQLTSPELSTNFSTGINFNKGEGYIDTNLQIPQNTGMTSESAPTGQDPFRSRVPIGAFVEGIAGLASNWGNLDLPTYEPTEFKPGQVATNLVDYSRGREQTMRERDQANAIIGRGAAQGGSQSALMERLMAGTTQTQRTAGTALNQSVENQANINAQIKNQASLQNAQLGLTAAQMNERNRLYANQLERENALINEQRRGNRIASVTNAIGSYMGDRGTASNYDQMVNMELARNPNYGLSQESPTWMRRLLGFTDPINEVTFRNTNDKVS